jgi:hypothetical protein
MRPTLAYSPISSLRFVSNPARNSAAPPSLPTWTNCIPTCLISGEIVFLEETGCVGDNIFGSIGYLVRVVGVLNAYNARGGRRNGLLGAPSVITRKSLFFKFLFGGSACKRRL